MRSRACYKQKASMQPSSMHELAGQEPQVMTRGGWERTTCFILHSSGDYSIKPYSSVVNMEHS
jgi:hypothetical protein